MPQEAQSVNRCLPLHILNLCPSWGWVVNPHTPGALPVPIEKEGRWDPGLVWTDLKKRKSLASVGIWTQERPAGSKSLAVYAITTHDCVQYLYVCLCLQLSNIHFHTEKLAV
jgi:hypothetical protein